ncbi:helix-turn-helix domain-containing protein [Kineobactrum sediminis]|uniref:helix-turn-helix domain-containing protein n=1 Tax=Kineobactrum sediminis TaxID=1905677 RepID=UPI0011AF8607|nr:helix-turn-helix domain-containing protein [Kineobactrum sediminis]
MSPDSVTPIKPEPVAATHFVPGEIPRQYHLQLWRQACGFGTRVEPLEEQWRFLGTTSTWHAGDLVFMHAHTSPTQYRRTPQHTRPGRKGCVMLKLLLQGSHNSVIDDRHHFHARVGNITVQDWLQPFTTATSACEMLSVMVPRDLLRSSSLMNTRAPVTVWCADSTEYLLLKSALFTMRAQLEQATAEQARVLAAGFIGLLDGLLLNDRELLRHQYTDDSRLNLMKQYLNQHLQERGLGPERLVAIFHCSRATLYRLFQPDGGVAAYIQKQRLQQCLHELSRMQRGHQGLLDALATTWGFSTVGTFARQFKKHFGISALDALQARNTASVAVPAANTSNPLAGYWRQATRIDDWVRECSG